MRFVLPLVLLFPLLAIAGSSPAGAPCSNPNQCVSKICHEKRCDGSSDHPGGTGAFCRSNGHCKSRNCAQGSCAAPKAEKTKSTSPKGSGKNSVSDDDDEEEAEVAKPPEPEALPEKTPCAEDLLATIYKKDPTSRASQFAARDNCKHKPETIERAKKLFLDGYGYNFSVTLRTVYEATPEQLACAQKQYDKQKNGPFEVPGLCNKGAGVIACTDELTTLFLVDMKPDMAKSQAEIECGHRAPSIIATAKPLFGKYGTDFNQIASTIEKTTPEQLECVKHEYLYLTEDRTKYSGFGLYRVCEREPAAVECYFGILDGVMKEKRFDDRFRSEIEGTCRNSDPEDVKLAEQIFKTGYTGWFPRLISDIHDLKPEKRACLKKNLAKMTSKDGLRLPKECEKK